MFTDRICPAFKCHERLPDDHVLCHRHWWMTPQSLQRRMWRRGKGRQPDYQWLVSGVVRLLEAIRLKEQALGEWKLQWRDARLHFLELVPRDTKVIFQCHCGWHLASIPFTLYGVHSLNLSAVIIPSGVAQAFCRHMIDLAQENKL